MARDSLTHVCSRTIDFCSGGTENTPGGSIKNILEINGYSTEDLAFQVVTFYIGVSRRLC